MTEEFRAIEGFEGLYEISNLGNVKSFNGYGRDKKEKILAQSMGDTGYKHVSLYKFRKKKRITVHRIIAKAFIPNPENKRTVNHIDGNKLNNDISNLEWATHKENNKHAVDIGLISKPNLRNQQQGKNHHNSKFTEEDVLYIRKIAKYNGGELSDSEIAKQFGVTRQAIRGIVVRDSWKHVI